MAICLLTVNFGKWHPAFGQRRAKGPTDLGFVRSVFDSLDHSQFGRELISVNTAAQ